MNLIYQEAAWINLHCGCEWGVLCVMWAIMDRTDERWAGPRSCSLTPLCPDPVLSCCLATLADPRAWVRPASPNDVDRTAIECLKLPGDESQLLLFPLSKYSFNPRSSFQLNIWWSVSKCCCDCRECSQKRNKHFWKYLNVCAFFP